MRQAVKKSLGYLALFTLPLALTAAQVDPKAYLEHIKYLASPELKGRGTGSPELEKAAQYIESQYKSFGLQPVDGKNYELPFQVTMAAKLGAGNRMTVKESGAPKTLASGREFIPFSFSSSGQLTGEVVFAGFGITAEDYKYDDYAGLDVKDKIVLLLRHEPQEDDPKSVFAGKDLTSHATFADKAVNAKLHGARGVLLINDVGAHPRSRDDLSEFGRASGPMDSGIFFVQIKASLAEAWLKAEGKDLRQIEAQIDRDLKPQSFALSEVSVDLTVDIGHEVKNVHNVAAYLPGQTKEYVVVGAHYDHLGLGDEHSLAPSQIGQVHPGADDNASGTAGVIELARWFSQQPKPKRGVLFLNFAGEELGLLGSEWYVKNPVLPLEDAVAMINMDMIGRIRDGKVYLGGTGTGSNFDTVLSSVKTPQGLQVINSEKTGYGASDHTSFTTKQIPTLFFFSGLHADYHKPSDTWDKIDSADAVKLLAYVGDVVEYLEKDDGRPQFVRVVQALEPSVSSSSSSGYGPAFGSIPDFDEPPKGVRFADVRDGTPAAVAGLKAGDILIEFDGKEIGNLYDFTYTLRAHKPGDVVLVKVLRGSQTIEAKVLLTERR